MGMPPARPTTPPPGGPNGSEDRAPQTDRDGELHVPVLLERIVTLLAPALQGAPDRVLVDATLGMGGHSLALLDRFPAVRLIGIDRDPDALEVAGRRLRAAGFGDRIPLVHAANDQIGEAIAAHAPSGVHGILFDLGVSSLQLDRPDRGFSYSVDAPLDMRMDPTTGITAAEVLNTYPARDLARVLRTYGEERFATRIADAVVAERNRAPLTTSARLVELVRSSIPAAARRTGGNPAKRTFQALRIEVNDELGVLRRALPPALAALAVGGRILVMSFQSLEDRIVKQVIGALTVSTAPPGLPMPIEALEPPLAWLVRGSVVPDADEITDNPRAASARLRAAVRIRKAAA